MPMGPFRLSDLVGSDIGLHVGKNFVDSFPERVYVSQIFPMLVEAKRLGEKSGAGFYKVGGWGLKEQAASHGGVGVQQAPDCHTRGKEGVRQHTHLG